jgi:hypothetical protein
MSNPFTAIPVGTEIRILTGAITALVLPIAGLIIYNKKHPNSRKLSELPVVLGVTTVLLTILLVIVFAYISVANTKGLQYVNWNNMTLKQITETASRTPAASKTPDNLSGAIVILYKFGCPDCEGIYPELKTELQGRNNVYFVPSGSKLGKKLIKTSGILEVPTGVYIRRKPLANGAAQNNMILYTVNKNGKPVLNKNALEHLLWLQEKGK